LHEGRRRSAPCSRHVRLRRLSPSLMPWAHLPRCWIRQYNDTPFRCILQRVKQDYAQASRAHTLTTTSPPASATFTLRAGPCAAPRHRSMQTRRRDAATGTGTAAQSGIASYVHESLFLAFSTALTHDVGTNRRKTPRRGAVACLEPALMTDCLTPSTCL